MTAPGHDWDESGVRESVADARRLVVKVGSSSISTAQSGLDLDKMAILVSALAARHGLGRDVILVSSGSISAGMAPLGLVRRPRDLAHMQAAAAVGQGLLVQHYAELFDSYGIMAAQVLLGVADFTRRDNYANALRALGTLMRMGVVPVVNENDVVATNEIRFGDNDRIAALVAQMVRADALVILSDVDAVYTAHPHDPGAERLTFVPDIDHLQVDTHTNSHSGVGSGGMTSKLQAAKMAAGAGIPVLLASSAQAVDAVAGGPVGTVIAPVDKPRPRRLLWLAHASQVRGRLTLDAGAVRAVTQRNASLLAAGITNVTGDFVSGDPIELVDADGRPIARGLVNFDATQLPSMMGRKSTWLADAMGVQYEREVVHRDSLVLLDRAGVGSQS